MPIAIAIAGAAAVGAGASIISSSKASKTAETTAANNNALQSQIYSQNAATLAPFVASGTKAQLSINALLGLGGDTTASTAAYDAYKGSTGYQDRLTQGQNNVTAALGSKGLLDSGAALKSLNKYGQTFASNDFQTYLGNLQTQQQTGLSAASAQAGVGQNYANSVSANNNAAATTSANAALSQGAAVNSALGNIVSAYGYSSGLGSSYGGGSTIPTAGYGGTPISGAQTYLYGGAAL